MVNLNTKKIMKSIRILTGKASCISRISLFVADVEELTTILSSTYTRRTINMKISEH
jgi:hypothetical protein